MAKTLKATNANDLGFFLTSVDRQGFLQGHGLHWVPAARKLSAFMELSDADRSTLGCLVKRRRTFVAGRDLVLQGRSDHVAYIVLSGWACSYKLLPNGRRQIVDFQIPGDFLGLRSLMLHLSDQSVEPITDLLVAEIHYTDLLDAFRQAPRLATGILWSAARDHAMVVEHLVGIGRRDATVRMAHFLLETGERLSLVKNGTKAGYACPLTQYHLADALGLSSVHVNRVLRLLREEGLVTFRDGFVTFDAYDRLVEYAEFEGAYLDQDRPHVAAAFSKWPAVS